MESNMARLLDDALKRRDIGSIRQAIRAGADFSRPYGDGFDLVSAALFVGQDILEAVLAEKVDPDLRLGSDLYPLERAIIHKDIECVKLLVSAGASLEKVRNEDGDTAVHRCAYDGNLAISRFLYPRASTSLLNQLNYSGDSALSIATKKNDISSVELLLGLKVELNPTSQTDIIPILPLVVAVEAGNETMVDQLLLHGANPLAQGWMGITALARAAELKKPKILERLRAGRTRQVRTIDEP